MTGRVVVVKGLDGAGKSTLVPRLAESLNAVRLARPPRLEAPGLSPEDLRSHFDGRPPPQRRAYYRAANLVASEQAACALEGSHVVMDRYWPSTVAYAALDEGFDAGNDCGPGYPPELRRPDAVILLTVTEEARAQRMGGRGGSVGGEERALALDAAGRELVLRRYREFSTTEIDTSDLDAEAVLEAALDALDETGVNPNSWLGAGDIVSRRCLGAGRAHSSPQLSFISPS